MVDGCRSLEGLSHDLVACVWEDSNDGCKALLGSEEYLVLRTVSGSCQNHGMVAIPCSLSWLK